jgi:linearmycin/streptolysin S transport system permease protein
MAIWTLAKKDLRLLVRDPKAAIILLAMPLIFILVLGLSLGQGFGLKPDDRLRVSLVDLDQGYCPARIRAACAGLMLTPSLSGSLAGPVAALALAQANHTPDFPDVTWAEMVNRDLAETGGIRVELIPTRAEAQRLVKDGKRAAVLVFGPHFSERVARSSFLAEGINPFYRDGVDLRALDAEILRDPTQLTAASIIEQVAQTTLLRVVLPWMIGQAFEKVGDPVFINKLRAEQGLPFKVRTGFQLLNANEVQALGGSLQNALQKLFSKYNLTAKTWASLTKADPRTGEGAAPTAYEDVDGTGPLKRGALRYQILVPSYTVMFAFFLVLTVGWLFVSERRQGTLKRLSAAPLTRTQILLGKTLPCFFISLAQGLFLLGAGKLIFDMRWGTHPGWLLLVVFTTSLASIGLALLVASLATTETQVAIYGTLLVLVLAGLSGCMMGDRSLMPEEMQRISLVTPHAWALDAYKQLLANPGEPNLTIVGRACVVLTAFGAGFLSLAWWNLKLD